MHILTSVMWEWDMYLLNTKPVQLDSDGDGQLSLEEFKVLFENAEKRKKDTKHSDRKVCVICN